MRKKQPPAPRSELEKLLHSYLATADSAWRREQAKRFRKGAAQLSRHGQAGQECAGRLARLEEHSHVLRMDAVWEAATAAMWDEGVDDVLAAHLADINAAAVSPGEGKGAPPKTRTIVLVEELDRAAAAIAAFQRLTARTTALILATAYAVNAVRGEVEDKWFWLYKAIDLEETVVRRRRSSAGGQQAEHPTKYEHHRIVQAAVELGWPGAAQWGLRTRLAKRFPDYSPQRIGQILSRELKAKQKKSKAK